MSNNKEFTNVLDAFKKPERSFNLHQKTTGEDNKIYLCNTGGYLMHLEEVIAIKEACEKYLEHINEEFVLSFNKHLRNIRQADRRSFLLTKKKSENKETYIYLMFNKRNGYYKIGRSSNPIAREKTLQAEEPEIELLHFISGTHVTELLLHEKFKDKRVRGEWFALNDADIAFIHSL